MQLNYAKEETTEHYITLVFKGKLPKVIFKPKSEDYFTEKVTDSLQCQYQNLVDREVNEHDYTKYLHIKIVKVADTILHAMSITYYDEENQKQRYYDTVWISVHQLCEIVGGGRYYHDPVSSITFEVVAGKKKQDIFIDEIDYAEYD